MERVLNKLMAFGRHQSGPSEPEVDAPRPEAADSSADLGITDPRLPPIIVSQSVFDSPGYQPLDIYRPSLPDAPASPAPASPAPASPVIVSCPHAGRIYPADLTSSIIQPVDALRGLEDFGVDYLLSNLPENGISCVVNRIARGYLDVNRAATSLDKSMFDAPISVPAADQHVRAGYGLLPRLTATRQPIYDTKLAVSQIDRRINAVHTPYHDALGRLMNAAHDQFSFALLVDFHSMPAVDRLNNRLPDIICGDAFGVTLDRNLATAITGFLKKSGLSVGWNTPYAGGYITRSYGDARSSRQSVQIEINRALYMDGNAQMDPVRSAALADQITDLARHLADYVRAVS